MGCCFLVNEKRSDVLSRLNCGICANAIRLLARLAGYGFLRQRTQFLRTIYGQLRKVRKTVPGRKRPKKALEFFESEPVNGMALHSCLAVLASLKSFRRPVLLLDLVPNLLPIRLGAKARIVKPGPSFSYAEHV
jgi:hypothetical protein